MTPFPRQSRRHPYELVPDQRNEFQRDRDRIIYTSAFRRLAWVTQVVSAQEGDPFHNRLTHTMEVAQVARRLAEKLLREQPREAKAVGGIDPEVVEAAALAHDLGHPPFGHAAEKELDRLAVDAGLRDGFEGNAQSFRIVTKLAARDPFLQGLNLTRATLNSIIKYPWLQTYSPDERRSKWGAYNSEAYDFRWARGYMQFHANKTAEAELMDFADDIAYAVHDVEDFYRAGLIPLDRLSTSRDEVDRFLNGTFENLIRNGQTPQFALQDCRDAVAEILTFAPVTEPYSGTRQHRGLLRTFTAGLIGEYIDAIKLRHPSAPTDRTVEIDAGVETKIFVSKQLTWHYVIYGSALQAQQFGQRRIVQHLFNTFNDAADPKKGNLPDLFPPSHREPIIELIQESRVSSDEDRIRLVTDLVAGMTESQAISMYQRLTGMNFGTVRDRIVQ